MYKSASRRGLLYKIFASSEEDEWTSSDTGEMQLIIGNIICDIKHLRK